MGAGKPGGAQAPVATEKEQQQKGINMGPGYASMSEQFFVPGYKEKMEKLFGKKV